jgi:hypothetical protein
MKPQFFEGSCFLFNACCRGSSLRHIRFHSPHGNCKNCPGMQDLAGMAISFVDYLTTLNFRSINFR